VRDYSRLPDTLAERDLTVREGSSASLEEWVLDRRIDIALLQDPPAIDELDVEPLLTERLGLVSGSGRCDWRGRTPSGSVTSPA